MKKIIILLCLFSFWKVNAQISITSSDMPTPGDMPRSSLADSISAANITYNNTGANYTWDYSTLQPRFQKVDTFITTPFTYLLSFTTATVTRRLPVNNQGGGGGGGSPFTITSGYEFFRTTPTKFERLGYGGNLNGAPVSFVNNPKDIVYQLPLQFGTKDTSISKAALNIPGLAYVEQNQTRYNHVDGWGTITTPYGTFDCMRISSRTTGRDSINYNGFPITPNRPPRTEYKWLAKGEVVPILLISTATQQGIEKVSSVTYRDSLRNDVPMVGIEKETLEQLDVATYPNPTSDFVHFDWSEKLGNNATCTIFDASGKEIFSQNLGQNQVLDLNVRIWESGTYFVKIGGDKKQFTGTLLISK